MSARLTELNELIDKLAALERELESPIRMALETGRRLRDAVREVANASSGSWVGWHSRMYYAGYGEPPASETWNTEWGGIHGFSPAWESRTLAEVQTAVEERAGLTLAELASQADNVRQLSEVLHREALTILEPLCARPGFETEKELLERFASEEWTTPPDMFIQAMAPGQLWSRDTHAMSQGMQAPLHLNVEAAIVSNTSTVSKAQEFVRLGLRAARQVRMKLEDGHDAVRALAPTSLERGQLRLRSRLLFWVLTIILVGALVAVLRSIPLGLASAALIVGVGLAIGALYGWLFDRWERARRVMGGIAVLAGAVAAVDQVLSRFA